MKHRDKAPSDRHAWPVKVLAAAIITGLMTTPAYTDNSQINRKPIGDLEIYAAAKPGTATIFMMLDISGSMDERSIENDYGDECESKYKSQSSEEITAVIRGRDADGKLNSNLVESINFTPKGCYVEDDDDNDVMRFDRLTRLQKALIEMLADEVYKGDKIKANNKIEDKDKGTLPDDYEVGVGAFSYDSDGDSAYVLAPTRALTPDQRIELIKKIKELTANGGTPTAPALTEAGAYMMGTTTIDDVTVAAEREYYRGNPYWRRCYSNESSLSYDDELDIYVYDCRNWGSWDDEYSSISGYVNSSSNIDHDDRGRTYFAGDNENSGFAASITTSKVKNENKNAYISPLNDDECSGNGIYLLTDGVPSNNIKDSESKAIMNMSLKGSTLSIDSCDNSSLTGLSGSSKQGWGCMASYSQLLRNPANPGKLPIKTATVGFGKTFDGLTGTRDIITNGKKVKVVDCESGSVGTNARNLCRLGERKGDNEVKTFGDGGFYYTEESKDIAASVADFAANLVQTINTAPSGTITIPDDPYRAANQLPYAYLPMLDPDIASAASIWRGNLKKYNLDEGTLYGKSDNLLFKNIAGELNTGTRDLWQDGNFIKGGKTANNDIMAGGVYAQLKTPASGLSSVRTVYVEDTSNNQPILRKVSVDSNGKPVGFDTLVDNVYNKGDEINKRRLLSFLGFDEVLTNDGQPTSNKDVNKLKFDKPVKEVKVLGGVVHSTPTAVSYGADLDGNGRITDTRDDYVLFGSMDGALHLVDAETGEEEFAIIPKLMMETQPKALVDGSFKDEVGTPYFGVDAPWLVETDYNYDLDNNRVTASSMMAYGGLRMGGEAFYGIDISERSSPKIEFSITPEGLNGDKSTNFSRLGQIWSKPTAAKIRLTKGSETKKNTEATDVLIFGGGYDMSYEDAEYLPTASKPAQGNAIYMINAKTGELIWSASKSDNENMIHSFTGEITVLDRDNDGLMDHLYAADLGGQVFRADFENARIEQFGFEAVSKFGNKGITRILQPNSNDKYAYRFYNRPVVSFYRSEGGVNNGKIFALVNVISGNRSSPLSTLRDNNKYANRIYGIIDSDVTSNDLYKNGFKASITELKDSDLVNLADKLGAQPNEKKKTTTKNLMITGDKKGWYYPLTRFDGYNNVRYNKGVGGMTAINNILYTTVYNPDKLYGTVSSCAARIMGGSERQLYCLPYGICMDETSITGTGGFIPAGQGIQELTLGAYNTDNKDVKVLIGTTTITERIKAANRAGYNEDSFKNDSNIKDLYPGTGKPTFVGGDGSATEFLFNERYTLQPKAWYQQRTGE
ncbi:PilC/PilY family type IV pilus protein [uncultured Psychrobacter sp.]|uniref:PilC/PilY family type IV pilus protein n=1 Tax=uncultured Psychrobacter sp. TaxID=259303 RepID=UPI002609C3F0|nr:PilC/PilY family type IV pilus protein [uncultured Psychrobacter sp.]